METLPFFIAYRDVGSRKRREQVFETWMYLCRGGLEARERCDRGLIFILSQAI